MAAPHRPNKNRPGDNMDVNAFWEIIAGARSEAADDEEFLSKIAARLRTLSAGELLAFERHFNRIHRESFGWRLWGAAYLMNGGCSDDGFEYFRAWLIAQGRETFEAVLEDPDRLAMLINPEAELEEFMYVAGDVYEEKTGRSMANSAIQGPAYPELGEGWDFDSTAEMRQRYPKLFAKYG
jgi:hypothetical protein